MSPRASRTLRYVSLFVMDALLILVLFLFSCWACVGNDIFTASHWPLLLVGLIWGNVFSLILALCGFYRIANSRIGLFESLKIMTVATLVDATSYALLFIMQNVRALQIPWVLNWRVFLLMVIAHIFGCVALRFLPRIFRAVKARLSNKNHDVKALLIGAGDAAKILIDENRLNPASGKAYVGALDDDPLKQGTTIGGVRVLGDLSKAKETVERLGIEEVIIAIPSLPQDKYVSIVESLSSCNVRLRRIPSLDTLDKINETKVVDVSYRDLLGRPHFDTHRERVAAKFSGKTVLITGGGGTIGAGLALELLRLGARRIVLLDQYENGIADALTRCRDLIRKDALPSSCHVFLASVQDQGALERAFLKYTPDYVFHTAAVKHVPLAEDHPHEAILTNVIGTDNLCNACLRFGVKEMYFLSTDKAIHPDSAMAKTKRIGEIACAHYASLGQTKFYALRFGNVLASKGSVVPIFSKQIASGGPVTVTSEDASRYFFTLEDCVSLLLEAVTMDKDSTVFDLEAGRSTSILSLAESLIRQAGYIPYKDIQIVVTGLRHGEATPKDAPYDRAKQTKTDNPHVYTEEFGADVDYRKIFDALSKASIDECKAALESISL